MKKRNTRHLKTPRGLEVSVGNSKLGTDTFIFNMGAAHKCPSRKLGLCSVNEKCYALGSERLWKSVLAYRNRQEIYWKSHNAKDIIIDLEYLFFKHYNVMGKVKYFRFNESGDFWAQSDIEKLNVIAEHLRSMYNIVTYGYTARNDLDFSKCSFLVKGSNNDNGNNGKTIVIDKASDKPKGFKVCPADCSKCLLCKSDKKYNIAFVLHGGVYSKLNK